MADSAEQIITTPEQLRECCAHLAALPAIGFDTEFIGEQTYHPRLCLVQVAAPDRLYLLDPLALGHHLDQFWGLLLDPGRVVVVHAGREEVRLCRLFTGQPPANLFDLQLAAGLCGLAYPLGHGTLVQQVLGVRLAKGETLTEWGYRPLTPEQVCYAFDDVRFLLRAYEKLSAQLAGLGRLEWAREECTRLAAQVDPDGPAQEERWRKLRGVGGLDRRRLAVVRALYEWRERRAAEVNRPARTVVRDDLVVEIARRNPIRERDLESVRGLGKRDLTAIVAVVEEARRLPPEQCPAREEREQDLPQLTMVANILIAVLGDLCARRQLATNLVASNADVRLLVRARLAGADLPEMPLTQGWRGQHLLSDLLDVLEGRRLVGVGDLRAEAPLKYQAGMSHE
jgi:ribonuclease D